MSNPVKIACLSDIHGHLPRVPDCDLVVLAGDLCASDSVQEQMRFLNGPFRYWCDDLPAPLVFTAGNHDWALERTYHKAGWAPQLSMNADLLMDWSAIVSGLFIYGSPWSLPFRDWAFMEREELIYKKYQGIPRGLDILISHGPPLGVLDTTDDKECVGSQTLLAEIKAKRPRLVVFGHVHEARGVEEINGIIYVNAAYVDEDYRPYREGVIVVELERKNNA